MPLQRLLAPFAVLVLAISFSVGCNKPPEAKSDPEALKKELEELNNARKKEWGQ